MEEKGKISCSNGDFITDAETCKKACDDLKIPKQSILGGYVCYKDGKGYCYQNGYNGAGASMICKKWSSSTPAILWKLSFHLPFICT